MHEVGCYIVKYQHNAEKYKALTSTEPFICLFLLNVYILAKEFQIDEVIHNSHDHNDGSTVLSMVQGDILDSLLDLCSLCQAPVKNQWSIQTFCGMKSCCGRCYGIFKDFLTVISLFLLNVMYSPKDMPCYKGTMKYSMIKCQSCIIALHGSNGVQYAYFQSHHLFNK